MSELRLHGPTRVGVRPGTELIHTIGATSARPVRFAAEGLPRTITLDPATGILRGRVPDAAGSIPVRIGATDGQSTCTADLDIVVGDRLALTPPMGWNSWNVFGPDVSAAVVMRVADELVARGFRDLGYAYVNIDDHWHAVERGPDGAPRANPATFPDGIGPVADHVHSLGLKLGIYSDAGDRTCGGCFGGYGHEEIDAATYAAWGVDYLKYDYCHAPVRRTEAIPRYRAMADALAGCGRSIVFSVCEWGLRRPWLWAPDLGASLWRTTPDLFDSFSWGIWGVRGVALRNVGLDRFAGPGRWNDPDMLVVGNRGRGRVGNRLPIGPARARVHLPLRGLDDAQSRTQMSLWAMMAAPLLMGADPADLSPADAALLLQPDLIAINQDALGVQARLLTRRHGLWVLRKPLADGSVAVSFTNLRGRDTRATVALAHLGVVNGAVVHDIWAGRRLGASDAISVELSAHQTEVFVLRPPD